MVTPLRLSAMALAAALSLPAKSQVLGADAAACAPGGGPAVLVNVAGLKDRKGEVKLELWAANADEFLQDDIDLLPKGKLFRRVRAPMPEAGPVALCMRVPRPGRYALLVTHNRDGKEKFSIWQDGAGVPSNRKLGRSRPKVTEAIVDVPAGVGRITVRVQYLRGLSGFAPLRDD